MPLNATFTIDTQKWDAALKHAVAGLKSLEVSGKGAQRQLDNMAKSFSGVEIKKQAEVAVAAVKAIGGVTKLTESEQRKLNATVTEAIAKYHALGQQAPADMIALAKATEKVVQPTQSAALSVKTLVAGYLSGMAIWEGAKKVLGGIVDFLGSSIQSYAAAESATKKLTQALKNTGNASSETVSDLSTLASEFQRTTRFSDDLVTEVEALFTQLGDVGPKQMKLAVQTAADLAEGLGVDLEQAAKAVSKALQGNDTALRKLAPSLDEAAIKGGDLATIAAEVNRQFGGQAAAALDTYSGRVQQLANDWDNVKEAIGKAIVNDSLLRTALREISEATKSASEAQSDLNASQVISGALIKSQQGSMGVTLGLLDAWASNLTRVAEANEFVNRTIDALAKKQSTVSLKGVFPEITSAGLAEFERQNKAIDESREAAKKANEAYAEWAKSVTGLGAAMAVAQLEQRLGRLTREGRLNDEAVKAIVREYEALRTTIPRVGGALEDLRNSTIDSLVPLKGLQSLFQSLAQNAIPDATRMFKAGQAVVDNLNRSGTLLSRTVISLKDGMTAMPGLLKSTAVAAADLKLREDEAAEAAKLWRDNLEDLAQAFALLAQIAPGAIGKVIGLFGKLTSALNLGVKGMDSFNDGMAAFKKGDLLAGISGMASGILGIASAAISAGKAIAEMFHSRAEKTMARIAYDLGVSVTEEFAQGIEDTAESVFGGNRQAARIFSLKGIIDQAGGISGSNFKPLVAEFRALFSMLETGAFTSGQAIQVLDENFRSFADFVTKDGSLASKELLDIIDLTERFGLKSAEVSAFVVQETGKAIGGLTTFLQNAQVKTQAAADGIGAALFGIFEAQTANGVPAAEILKQLVPLIENLDAQLKKAGLSGGASFTAIKDLAAVASHEIAGPLITGILGLGTALEGLHNSGVLTEEMFDGLTASIADTYKEILATGVDGSKALQLIAPSLQDLWELSQDFGYTVDENTQKLLDEAEAAGLVGDEHRTATEQMLKLTERMTTAVEYLAQAFGYVTDEVGDLGDAIDSLPEIPSARDIPDYDGGSPMNGGGDYHDQYYSARGGLVPKYLAGGGPSGTDTVPAWLTPGEFVMRKDAVSRIGASNLQALNSGADAVGGTVVNHYHTWNVLEGESVKRVVQSREFADAFVEGQARNTHTIRTRTKAALK